MEKGVSKRDSQAQAAHFNFVDSLNWLLLSSESSAYLCSAVRFKSLFESKKVIEYEKNLRIQKKRINKRVFALIYAFAPFFRL